MEAAGKHGGPTLLAWLRRFRRQAVCRGRLCKQHSAARHGGGVRDPQADGWQPLARMSTARAGFGLVALGGKIYAIGGWTGEGRPALDSVEAYDPQLGSWALVASMSVTRRFHISVMPNGKIYAMGGVGDGVATLDTVEVYNPQASSWQRVASMPQGMYSHTAAAMGGKST